MSVDYDVSIVGFGPVGHVMALLLGNAGYSVGVFERQMSLYPLPRVGHIDHEAVRILQAVNAADAFDKKAYVPKTYEWVNGNNETLLSFDWNYVVETGWYPHYLFFQPDMDEMLQGAVFAKPSVDVQRGWEARSISQDRESVRIDLVHLASGEKKTVTSKYLIGADGANSFVRRAAGIAWQELGFFADWLVVDYKPNDPDADIDIPEAAQLCDPARPTSVFRYLGYEHARWEFMLMPGETAEQMQTEEKVWDLLSRWIKPGDGTLVRTAVYTFKSALAENWRKDRIFLVGDSAHLMPPFLGQGMCSGYRDAANLAWKLDHVLSGAADSSFLDTYTEERKPHVGSIIDIAVALGKVVCVPDPEDARLRDEQMMSGNAEPPPPFPTPMGGLFLSTEIQPLAGKCGPQGRVRTADGAEGRADDIVGVGWTLLTDDPAVAEAVDRAGVSLPGLKVAVMVQDRPDGDALQDVDGVYRGFFDKHGVRCLLVRPDFYIHSAAVTPDEIVRELMVLSDAVARGGFAT